MSDTPGTRLKLAVNWWAPGHGVGKEGNAKTFQRAMEDRLSGGKSGASYRAVLAYMQDESEPSLQWLREAADLLGVRPQWLVFGDRPVVGGGRTADGVLAEIRLLLESK